MPNRYDILTQLPSYESEGISPAQEALAQQLVSSGRLRIKSDYAKNYVHYSGSSFDYSFSLRELSDPNLLPDTRARIRATLPGSASDEDLMAVYERLLRDCKTARNLSPEREMQIARLLIQATHPVVIEMCLLERVDLYVSYAHDVADLFPIHFWEQTQHSGGLQSISGDGAAVYVSCGGDPFIESDEQKTYQGDGFPALARMMVIAGQELGHYADLMRTRSGQIASRHSASLMPLQAKERCAKGRLDDMKRVKEWRVHLNALGIDRLAALEKQLAFYAQHRRFSLPWLWLKAKTSIFKWRLPKRNDPFLSRFPNNLHGSQGYATDMIGCLEDMAFNLAPQAEAYQHEDPIQEEAIACIEALARVPQQAIKWGDAITQLCWPNLWALYQDQVIPANIAAYEILAGKKWHFPEIKPNRKRWRLSLPGLSG